jgi:translation initiation factor IF-2
MTEGTKILRLSKLAIEFNIGISTIVDFLAKKGIHVDQNPNTKISEEAYQILSKEFQKEKSLKDEVRKSSLSFVKRERISLEDEKDSKTHDQKPAVQEKEDEEPEEKELFIKDIKSFLEEKKEADSDVKEKAKLSGPKILGKIDADKLSGKPASKPEKETPRQDDKQTEEKATQIEGKQETGEKEDIKAEVKAETIDKVEDKAEVEVPEKPKSKGPKILGKIDIDQKGKVKKDEAVEKTEPAKEEKVPDDTKGKTVTDDKSEKPDETGAKDAVSEEKTPQPIDKTDKQEPLKTETELLEKPSDNIYKTQVKKLEGVTILGKIDLPAGRDAAKKPVASSSDADKPKRRKRKRIRKERSTDQNGAKGTQTADQEKRTGEQQDNKAAARSGKVQQQQQQTKGKKFIKKDFVKPEVSDEEISRQIRETLASLSGTGKSKGSKYRRQKRDLQQQQKLKDIERAEIDQKVLKVTEFVSANELASLMNVPVTEIISTCMSLGLFVSINQRLDAETITIVADEFGYEVDFVSVDAQEAIKEVLDAPEDLKSRAPIVTVMGHVDHGKTSLLDNIRHSNVIAGEAGGITQHIGAYSVQVSDDRMITFLDTPGHEAFTAMRARGAKVTDVAIIVVAADDNVMPQTVEAINHAQAANVPIVIAINKIDKPTANVERVKEELAKLNILVEDWGGKYQSQEISAKNAINIDKLLEKVLLEAELLDLKANPERKASGTVIESSLDKGRGYLATILVQNGTLKVGDIVVAGNTHGRIKAMFNERNVRVTSTGPATPALILGLDGAPQAGDTFNVVNDEQEAKSITSKRQQLLREQGLRTQKHITLDEIGRRIAIGDFKELNIIVKGDVDGSVEALSDSLLKLSTEEVQVNIIHKAVGSITEGDVLLASASNAVIVGFQVRPSLAARKLAENEEIDIRIYSVIYNAINEIKSAIEGMLSPEIEEKVTANIEVREVFKITKVGTIAGCMVLDGKITRNSRIRVIRDGIVVYTGHLGSLKRFKDDVKDVSAGYECGLNIERFNDIKVGDIIEAFETYEIARKLE